MNRILSIFKNSLASFEGKALDEYVVLLLRRHIFTIFIQLAFYAIAGAVPFLISHFFGEYIVSDGFKELFSFGSALWFLCLWLAVFYSLTLYTLNTVIITNKRIIENEQLGLFNRKVSELHYGKIQDVSVRTRGFIETLLHFGNVNVQTAAAEREFTFRQLPRPEQVKDEIMRIMEKRSSNGGVHN